MPSYCKACGVKKSILNIGGSCKNRAGHSPAHLWYKRYEPKPKGGGGNSSGGWFGGSKKEKAQESQALNGCAEVFGNVIGGAFAVIILLAIAVAALKAAYKWFLEILPALINALVIGLSIAACGALVYFAFRSKWFRDNLKSSSKTIGDKSLKFGKKIIDADYKSMKEKFVSPSVTIKEPKKEKVVKKRKKKINIENLSNEQLISMIKKTHSEVKGGDSSKNNKLKILMMERDRRLKIKSSL
jgi:hypothetical protein